MDIFGNNGGNPFDQELNTTDAVDFTRVDVTAAIVDPSQLATKLYVDTHGGGGGGGNMTYTGITPATNNIYKALASDGHDATTSNITDNGTTVTITANCVANQFIKNGGTAIQYLMGDGSTLTQSATSGNSNFYLYRSIDGVTTPPPLSGNIGYNNTNQSLATIVYISHLTRDNIDIEVFYNQINQLNDLYVQDQNNSVNFIKYNITGVPAPVPNSYIAIPVIMATSGGTGTTSFGANHNVLLAFFSNLTEVDQRLSTLETKTFNQTATAGTTNFSGTVSANTLSKVGGLNTQFLKADGTVDNSAYITNPTYNLGVTTLNNALTISPMTSNSLPAGYLATSDFAGTANFQAFDLNTATAYSSYANYSSLTGTYSGYIQTPLLPFGTLNGDWLQIEYPSAISVVGYTLTSNTSLSQVPSTFTILTSTDNVNWTAQDSEVGIQWVLGTPKTFTFASPVTSKYFRLSVYLVGNTGTSTRTNFVVNELSLTQNTSTNSVTVPTMISNKTTFTNANELISKLYADTTPGIIAGLPFNPTSRASGTLTSSTKSYYFTCLISQACLISGFTVYLDSGADPFRMAIYRGALVSGTTITLCGQSAGGLLNQTTVFNRFPITQVVGQSLSFASGDYMTIAFHSQGSTNIFLGSPVATSISVELAWNSIANYVASPGFPATLAYASVLGPFTVRPCFELY